MVKRKWLIKELPKIEIKYLEKIETCYVSFQPEVKLKKITMQGNINYYLIVRNIGVYKKMQITKFQYDELVDASVSDMLVKTRTKYSVNGLNVSVDNYLNFTEKLTLANITFKCEDESEEFIPPQWFGREVTDVENFKTKNLSVLGF
jgi:CYTH domain-containing protein